MNPAAGCTAQRQSGTLIAALKTRVADQSSDACQYFRIIAEGCSLLVFPFLSSLSLSTTFYPVNSLLPPSHSTTSFFFYVSSPLLLRVCTQSQTSVVEKAKRRAGSGFLKRPDDTLMRSGLCGWTEATDSARDRLSNKGRANRDLRTSLGSSRRSLVSCWDLPLFN